jgi:hypothetical protein
MSENRQSERRRRFSGPALGLGIAFLLVAWTQTSELRAQDEAQPQNEAQSQVQPARAIRLSYVDGKVSLTNNGGVLAAEAAANTPLFQGTEIKTADDGRAEIQFEEGSVARLAPNTSVTLTTLSGAGPSGDAEIAVQSGLAYFELQENEQSGIMRIHFGDAQVTASGFTVLRVSLDTPPGAMAVLSGNARVERGGALANLHGGESIALDASNAAGYEISESVEPDTWDSWNSDRDEALTSEASQETEAASKVSGGSTNPAWSALDANGNWYNVPGQGYVWSPYDASNSYFDPYGNGNWLWTPGYGYLWVSGYTWGYLPYQCGAWNFYGGFGWGWAPGFGGCSPWWGVGYYPGPVLGIVPVGYRPIRRPHIPVRITPGRRVIPEKRPSVAYAHNLPARTHNTVVQIAGNTVRPLPLLVSRPQYNRSTGGISPGTHPRYLTAPKSNVLPARPETTPGSVPARTMPRSTTAPPVTTAPRSVAPATRTPSAPATTAPIVRPSAPVTNAPRITPPRSAPPAAAPRSAPPVAAPRQTMPNGGNSGTHSSGAGSSSHFGSSGSTSNGSLRGRK